MNVSIFKVLIGKVLKNLVGMLLTEKMVLWALKFSVKQTKNSVDDNVVAIVEAAYKNDAVKFQAAVEATANAIKNK
jgi:hypothetical protein